MAHFAAFYALLDRLDAAVAEDVRLDRPLAVITTANLEELLQSARALADGALHIDRRLDELLEVVRTRTPSPAPKEP
jgi:hypothetical protein